MNSQNFLKNEKPRRWPLLLALIFLLNPNVHVVDILPDFIAYLIIAGVLGYPAPRVPYFEEARNAMLKLALISALKIPAFFLLSYVRSGNYSDSDIFSLFSFSFGAVECIYSILAINALFRALFYLGQRSEATSLINPFVISKRGRKMTPEALRTMAIAFTAVKCAGYALPELLLLTKTVDAGAAATYFNVARLYPYVIIITFALVLVFGIINASRFWKYIKAIRAEGTFITAIDGLTREEAIPELRKKLWLRDMRGSLLVLAIVCIFTFEIRFDNFSGINLVPDCLFPLLLSYGIYRIGRFVGGAKNAVAACLFASGVGLLSYATECLFLSFNTLEELASSSVVRSDYLLTVILSGVECLALAAMLFACAKIISKFASSHTGVDPESERFMRQDAMYLKQMTRKIYIWAGLGIVSAACDFLNTMFKMFSKNTVVSVGDSFNVTTEIVTEGFLPWFGTVYLFAAILFAAWSFYLFGSLREDCEIKYI